MLIINSIFNMGVIRNLINHSSPINRFVMIRFIFWLIIVLFIFNFKDIKKSIRINYKDIFLLCLIFLFASIVRLFFVPHVMLIEHYHAYEHMATAFEVATGNYDRILGASNLGFHYLLSLYLRVFGTTPDVAYDFNSLVGALSAVAIFFLAYILFKDKRIAYFSSLTLAVLPVHLKFSGSLSLTVLSLFFGILTLTIFLVLINSKFKIRLGLLAVLLLIYFLQIRGENIFFLVVILVLYVVFFRNIKEYLRNPKYYVPWIIFIILLIPHTIIVLQGGRQEVFDRVKDETFNSLLKMLIGLQVNPFALFFIVGLIFLIIKKKGIASILLVWLGLFFYVYITTGNNTIPYTGSRYFVNMLAPYVIICAYGIKIFISNFDNKYIKYLIIVAILSVPFLYSSYLNDYHYNEQEEYEFIRKSTKIINEGCVIIIPYSSPREFGVHPIKLIHLYGKNIEVIEIDKVYDNKKRLLEKDCIYYYEGLYCYMSSTPAKKLSSQCEYMHNNFYLRASTIKNVKSRKYSRYEDAINEDKLTFAFYNLNKTDLAELNASFIFDEDLMDYYKEFENQKIEDTPKDRRREEIKKNENFDNSQSLEKQYINKEEAPNDLNENVFTFILKENTINPIQVVDSSPLGFQWKSLDNEYYIKIKDESGKIIKEKEVNPDNPLILRLDNPGIYFFTCCSKDREEILGNISIVLSR